MKRRYLFLLLASIFFINVQTIAQDPDWVKENTWYFDNFVKDTLPWTMFRETFIGVAPAPSADFDQFFYDGIYQTKLAGPGHCYGMCVLAMMMMKNGGFLGYCHPPYTYSGSYASPGKDTLGPSDPNLNTAIGIMHGYQINHGFLSFLLDVIAISKNRDGRYAFQQVDYYLAKNDPPVISVTKGLSPADGGHVLIPFFTQDLGGTKRIYVYDPNRSYYEPGANGKDWYINGNNFISVNSGTGEWKFDMGGEVWTGHPGGGGNLLTIPISVAGKKDRLPQSLLADGAYALNTIFIFGDVKVEQISDMANTRHYLNKDGTDIEPLNEKRLNNILPFIPFGGGKSAKQIPVTNATYFFRGAEPVNLQYRACGDYRIGAIFQGKYYEIKAHGDGSIQHFQTTSFLKQKKRSANGILPPSKFNFKRSD